MISIIIPVYNDEEYLEECLDSIINQGISEWEIIAVNDGSTDSSNNILEQYARNYSNITVINQDNKGPGGARNVGLKVAKGDYVLFCDADDCLLANPLEIIKKGQIEPKDIYIFQGSIFGDIIDENSEQYMFLKRNKINNGETFWGIEYYKKFYKNQPFINITMMVIATNFLKDNKLLFQENIIHEDYDFFNKIILANPKMVFLDNIIYHRRYRDKSIMRTRFGEKNIYGYLCVYENMLKEEKTEIIEQLYYVSIIGMQSLVDNIKVYNTAVSKKAIDSLCDLFSVFQIKDHYTIKELLCLYDIGKKLGEIVKDLYLDAPTNKILKERLISFLDTTQIETSANIGFYGNSKWSLMIMDAINTLVGEYNINDYYIDSYRNTGERIGENKFIINVKDVDFSRINKIVVVSEKYENEIMRNIKKMNLENIAVCFYGYYE